MRLERVPLPRPPPCTFSRDREILAWCAAGEKIEFGRSNNVSCSIGNDSFFDFNLCHVAEIRDIGIVVRENAAREGFYLREKDSLRLNAASLQRERLRFYAAAYGCVVGNASISQELIHKMNPFCDPRGGINAPRIAARFISRRIRRFTAFTVSDIEIIIGKSHKPLALYRSEATHNAFEFAYVHHLPFSSTLTSPASLEVRSARSLPCPLRCKRQAPTA